jgi:hypothetical protein
VQRELGTDVVLLAAAVDQRYPLHAVGLVAAKHRVEQRLLDRELVGEGHVLLVRPGLLELTNFHGPVLGELVAAPRLQQ